MTENKRFTISDDRSISDHHNKRLYDLSDFDGVISVNECLNELAEENKLHKKRISLLSSLLDLADAIIDTSDNEKAKQVWDNKNEQTEKEWEKILNDRE